LKLGISHPFAAQANAGLKDYEGYDLASGGDGHVYFWTLRGQTLTATDPVWGAADDSQRVLCGAAVLDRFITGTRGGHLYVWKERSCVKQIRAHEHGLESIHAAGDAGFVTGAHDGFVKLWTSRCVHVRSYDLTEATIPPLVPVVHSVHLGLADGDVAKILVGTSSSEVYEIAKSSGSMTLLHEGHYTDELWAVATNPADPDVFATAGDDMTVRVWSVAHRKLLRKAQLDAPCRCLDFSPDGERLLVGMGGTPSGTRSLKDGVFLILDALSLLVQHEGRDSRHWLRCCKFAPDGLSFAVGSMDQKVYIYDAETTHMRAKCLKHNSFVTHLDWSADSKYVQSDARDYEHLYYGALDGAHVRLPSQLKDVEFAGWSCIYGWPTQGAWAAFGGDAGRDPKCDVTTVHRSNDSALLASGDEGGAVRLFRYPCAQKSVSLHCSHHHVAHVARVAFAVVWNSNLQPDFNVRVCDGFDARVSAVLRELDESNRFVQKSAESTSM
jgi:microtubule-associated protein-like 6